MANRQALRDLQQRLAQRMQAAREQTQSASWLAVDVAGHAMLFSLKQAAEIFSPVPLKAVPYSQPWMLGVANLRGGLHTVVDLAAFLGVREPGTRPDANQSRLVLLNAELSTNCALLVDGLLGLRSDEQLQAEPWAEPESPRPRFAGHRMRDEQGRSWQVLNLEALSKTEQFLRIVA